HVHLDEQTNRIIASTRIARHMDLTPPDFRLGQEVDLIIFGKTISATKRSSITATAV
ncbi:MAG: hypothetical protein HC845_14505, partial [Akkermansiaceae bacterium]|nr:hypothetical protein [Akkermansiaceae bacterium]